MIEYKKIKQKTIVQQIMERIKELIASGQYKVHDKMPTENELAELFGIGRSSIREAIKVFNYLGVLESHPAVGTIVCDRSNISAEALEWAILLGDDELDNLMEFRGAIELWSLIKLTEKRQENPDSVKDTLEKLNEQIENMRHAVNCNDMMAYIEAEYEFHSQIVHGCGNSLLISIYQVLKSFIYEEVNKAMKAVDLSNASKKHYDFIEVINSGDLYKVVKQCTVHINEIIQQLENYKKL